MKGKITATSAATGCSHITIRRFLANRHILAPRHFLAPRHLLAAFALLIFSLLASCAPAQPTTLSSTPPVATRTQPGPTATLPAAPTLTPAPTYTQPAAVTPSATAAPTLAAEVAAQPIEFDGPAAERDAEVSGMAWYGDWLVLLPQFPRRTENALHALSRAEITAYLESEDPAPLTPRAVPLTGARQLANIAGFEGFEAIAFHGEEVFLSIEANYMGEMKSYLIKGRAAQDLSEIVLDGETLTEAPLPTLIINYSNEALVIYEDHIYLFYEANGTGASEEARAFRYDLALNPAGELEMAQLEYRLTDASTADESGRFWVSNFFFPGDLMIYPAQDALFEQFGRGETHQSGFVVERLVELQLPPTGEGAVTFTPRPPLYIRLSGGLMPRNWEGLVRLDGRGFLVITDEYPETILAFLPYNE